MEGYAIEKQRFNAQGGLIETAYLDADPKPVLHPAGYATVRYADKIGRRDPTRVLWRREIAVARERLAMIRRA